ncbi:MAG: hypothetical protein ABSE73_00565 [Planctomycetota bacterium]
MTTIQTLAGRTVWNKAAQLFTGYGWPSMIKTFGRRGTRAFSMACGYDSDRGVPRLGSDSTGPNGSTVIVRTLDLDWMRRADGTLARMRVIVVANSAAGAAAVELRMRRELLDSARLAEAYGMGTAV